MTENKKRTEIATYKGVVIYVDENGVFYGTPVGARKEREARSLIELKGKLREAAEESARRKHRGVSRKFRAFIDGRTYAEMIYRGAFARHKSCGSGHVYRIGDDDVQPRRVRAFHGWVTDEERAELMTKLTAAQVAMRQFTALRDRLTSELKEPYVGDFASAEDLDRAQQSVLKQLDAARDAKRPEDAS